MKKQYQMLIEEDIYSRFQMAATISNQTVEDAVDICFRRYISETFGNVSREYATGASHQQSTVDADNWYGKANQRIPQWAAKPTQYNHKIIRAYFLAEEMYGDVAIEDIEQLCSDPNRPDLFVPTFKSNYAQMKLDGPKTHGKVFEDDGVYVTIWNEVEEVMRQYQNQFTRDISSAPVADSNTQSIEPADIDAESLWKEIVNEFTTNPRDVQTRPTGNRRPLWFYVSGVNGCVHISGGRTHENRSNIRAVRTLKEEELADIFSLYQRRKHGENVSYEATQTTQNQVYWYGIFAELGY